MRDRASRSTPGEPRHPLRRTPRPSPTGPRTALVVLLAAALGGTGLAGTAHAGPAGPAAAASSGAATSTAGASASTSEAGVVETPLRVPVGPEADGTAVELDASVFVDPASGDGPRAAVVLAHGYGGTKDSVADQARTLAADGYLVLTYSARGSGASGGAVHLDSPAYEGADVVALVDVLAARDDVRQDGDGDPRVGVAGGSYGGAAALLAAGLDPRVDAVVAGITWNDLPASLVPQSATTADGAPAGTGVLKEGWVSQLLAPGSQLLAAAGPAQAAATSGAPDALQQAADVLACGRLAPELCAPWLATASTIGTAPVDPALLELLAASSTSTVLDAVRAPTLLVQGQADTLFGLEQSTDTAAVLAANDVPVKVVWSAGGHDAGAVLAEDLSDRAEAWFSRYLLDDGTPEDTTFEYAAPRSTLSALSDQATGNSGTTWRVLPRPPEETTTPVALEGLDLAAAAGAAGGTAGTADGGAAAGGAGGLDPVTALALATSGVQPVVSPAGGRPAAWTSIPGLGSLSALSGLSLASVVPGQAAVFESDPLTGDLALLGGSTVSLDVTSSADDAVLFAALYDVADDGTAVLPAGLVAPFRVEAPAGTTTTVRVQLPTVVQDVPAGHSLRLVVSSTDQGYAVPTDARVYGVSLTDGELLAATAPADVAVLTSSGTSLPVPQLVVAGALLLAALVLALVTGLRRRRAAREADAPAPALVPAAGSADDGADAGPVLLVEDLVKEYRDGYRAVDGISFRVERGQVVGLLGPNGAGKTTTLRVLLGLLAPTSGRVEVMGRPVVSGAPALARVGALVEGPGFLPHRSGLENLHLYWRATGRPVEEARFEEALAVADLGAAVHRRVRSYSQGMRMRLGIAQAMLGLPDLLVLDEPTNGLDPPQITAMRQVLRDYAATGRTVLVSSHLLSEVEQTCTHAVVVGRGKILATGSVEDLVGASTTVAVTLAPAPAGGDQGGDQGDDRVVAAALTALTGMPGVRASVQPPRTLLLDLDPALHDGGTASVVGALVAAGVAVSTVVPQRHLEQVFLELVGGQA